MSAIAVISDLHLGRRGAADSFRHDDADFLRFLDFLEGNFASVVLLGDVWETLRSRRPRAQAAELALVRAVHPEIAARFRGPRYHYIHGNHDLVGSVVDRAPDYWATTIGKTHLYFTHGHAYDWHWQRARWLGELGSWAGGWLLRMRMRAVFRTFDKIDNRVRGARSEPERCAFQRWAVGLARQREADVIVTGHTHIGVRAEHGDKLFLNSGSCSQGEFQYLALEPAQGRFALHTSW